MRILAGAVSIIATLYGFTVAGLLGALTGFVTVAGVGGALAITTNQGGIDLAAGGSMRSGQRVGGILAAAGCLSGALYGGWRFGWLGAIGGYFVGYGIAWGWYMLLGRRASH